VQVLALLSADGLITLKRVMQDGTKIRAQAAGDSFRRKERVEQALKQAAEQVKAVGAMSEEETSRRMAKARQRAARERQERLERAVEEFKKLVEEGKDKEKRRVSTSDPEARVMKQPDGGFAPSYNVEIDTDAESGVVVAVGVVQAAMTLNNWSQGSSEWRKTWARVRIRW